jgi:hypothetical protein
VGGETADGAHRAQLSAVNACAVGFSLDSSR